MEELRETVGQGDTPAQNILGDCYAHGEGVEQDKGGVRLLRMATEQGNVAAHGRLKELGEQ
jgi:TPR repeat protein